MDEASFGQQLWDLVFPYLEMFIVGVFTVATPLVTKYAIGWLKAKTHSATFRCGLEKAEKMAAIGVHVAEQTYAAEKKRLSADGTLTAEEAKEAFGIASKAAMESLGAKWVKEMQGCMGASAGEVKTFVERLIESQVHQKKAAAAAAAAPAPSGPAFPAPPKTGS